MDPLLPRLEKEERRRRHRLLFRHSKIPVRMLVPNLFTLLSLCAGLTAIRMAIELRYEHGHRPGRHRRPARRRRRAAGARAQGAVQVRRRARQPRRLRQLRRGAGGDRVHLGARRPATRLRLDRRPGVRARHRPAACALQHHDRRRETQVADRVLHRHAGPGGRHHGAAAALSRSRGSRRLAHLALVHRRLHGGDGRVAGVDPSRPSRASCWASGSRRTTCCRCSWAWPRWWRCSSPIPTAR